MDLRGRELKIKEKCLQSLSDWKKMILDNLEDADRIEEIKRLQNIVSDYCIIDRDCAKNRKTLESLKQKIAARDEEDKELDLDSMYKEYTNIAEPSSESFEDDDIWQEILGDGIVVEVMKKKSNVQVSTFEELGDSLLLSNVFSPPIDPISKMVIRNPYKNRRCKHVYEQSTIFNYITQLKGKAKCPYIGCNNNQLNMKDLREDRDLQSQITEHLLTQGDEDNDSD